MSRSCILRLLQIGVPKTSCRVQLLEFEFADHDSSPRLARTNQRGVDQFAVDHRSLAERMRNHFRAPALFAEQPLEQIRGANQAAMGNRQSQVRSTLSSP